MKSLRKRYTGGHEHTCLQHLLKAEEGILAGAIWSNILPEALKSGITTMNIATETSPKHKTSAFSTLQMKMRIEWI